MSRKTGSALPSINSEDMCPVCKTIRYLNRDMEFLINPECYHSMCSNCVNRLFNDGPNQCPYAGCHRTLRRKGFRSAFFGDLAVEREVDIRRRVAAVFNQVEDDFETLEDYNNYLQMEKKKAAAPEGPYDPFGGLDFVPSRYRVHDGLSHPAIDKYRADQAHITGGYDFDAYTARAMFEAFAGLAVFIGDEKEAGGVGPSAGEVATVGATIAAGGDKMDVD
ncbi:hypothetical protein VTH06DRAFT_7976 [Thermothelomyces fergusii]